MKRRSLRRLPDPTPRPWVGFADDPQPGPAGGMTVTVRLSAATDRDVAVPLELRRPGAAATPLGVLTIPAGATSAAVVLWPTAGSGTDPLLVRIGRPTNAVRSTRADVPAAVRVTFPAWSADVSPWAPILMSQPDRDGV